MKWIKAEQRLPQHMVKVVVRRRSLVGGSTGWYDYSRKVFMVVNMGPSGWKIDGVEWLDETEDWISVDDQRKPEAEEEVLVYCKGIHKAVYFKDANVFYFSNTGGLANINFVTHWMPLPSPPTKQP